MSETYITTTGVELTIHAVPAFLVNKIQATVKFPKAPTYRITTVAGTEEEHEYNEEDIEKDEGLQTPEYREALVEYHKKMYEANAELNDKMMKTLFLKGVEVKIPDDWVEIQQYLGVEIPENPIERRYHYVITEAIGSLEEITAVMSKIMQLTGISQEVIDDIKSMFPVAVEGSTTGEAQS